MLAEWVSLLTPLRGLLMTPHIVKMEERRDLLRSVLQDYRRAKVEGLAATRADPIDKPSEPREARRPVSATAPLRYDAASATPSEPRPRADGTTACRAPYSLRTPATCACLFGAWPVTSRRPPGWGARPGRSRACCGGSLGGGCACTIEFARPPMRWSASLPRGDRAATLLGESVVRPSGSNTKPHASSAPESPDHGRRGNGLASSRPERAPATSSAASAC